MDILRKIKDRSKVLIMDTHGQGLVEYELVIALISIAAITVMSPLGAKILAMFEKIINELVKL